MTHPFRGVAAVSEWTSLPRSTYPTPFGAVPYAAETAVRFDSSLESLYFRSWGHFAQGAITFECEDEATRRESATLHIAIKFSYSAEDMLQHARVFRLSPPDDDDSEDSDELEGGQGIGIYVRLVVSTTVFRSLSL